MATAAGSVGRGLRALARKAGGSLLAEWVAAAATTTGGLHLHLPLHPHSHPTHQHHGRDCSSGGVPRDPTPVYGTGSSPKSHSARRVTTRSLVRKHLAGEKITVITAYDYPQAKQVDIAGADVVLVGDSAGMVVHGYDTTLPLTLEETLSHCRAAARGGWRSRSNSEFDFPPRFPAFLALLDTTDTTRASAPPSLEEAFHHRASEPGSAGSGAVR